MCIANYELPVNTWAVAKETFAISLAQTPKQEDAKACLLPTHPSLFSVPFPSSSTFFSPLFSFTLLFLHLIPISSPSHLSFSFPSISLPFYPPSVPACHALSFPPTSVCTLPLPLPTFSSTHPQQALHPHARTSGHWLALVGVWGKGRLGPSDRLPGLAHQLKSRPTRRVNAWLQHLLLAEGTVNPSGSSSRRRPQSLGE